MKTNLTSYGAATRNPSTIEAILKFSAEGYAPGRELRGGCSGSALASKEDGSKLLAIIQGGKNAFRVISSGKVHAL